MATVIVGTDSGPPCGDCFETLWIYSVESGTPHIVTPTCACCHTERAEFVVLTIRPSLDDVKRAHQARVNAERDKINQLIHGKDW